MRRERIRAKPKNKNKKNHSWTTKQTTTLQHLKPCTYIWLNLAQCQQHSIIIIIVLYFSIIKINSESLMKLNATWGK